MTRLPSLFPELPQLPRLGGAAARRTGRLEVTPEEEESLARKAGRIGLGGIAAVGNLLDLPGSSVRDVLAGQNPLDQWLHPFSGEKRTTGRDILRKVGLIGQQDNWKNMIGGIGAEIAMDPLTYIFPLGAMTKAGKIAKAAGLADKTMGVAATKLGRPVASLGRREAAVATTLDDLIQSGGTGAREAAETAAKGMGVRLDEVLSQPTRGMFATGILGNVRNVYGTGAKGMKVARAVDTIGSKMRFARIPGTQIQPLNALARTFSAPLKETRTATAQPFAKQLFGGQTKAIATARQEVAGYVDDLVKSGHATDAEAKEFRGWLENIHADPTMRTGNVTINDVPANLRGVVQKIQQDEESVYNLAKSMGVDPEYWSSPYARHISRHMTEIPGRPGTGAGGYSSFGAMTPEMKQRMNILSPYVDKDGVTHAIHGETYTIQKIVTDPRLEEMRLQGASIKDRAAYIEATYGQYVPAKYAAKTKKGVSYRNRYQALAQWHDTMDPGLRETGMFGNHPLADIQAARINARQSIAAAETVKDLLISPEVLKDAGTIGARESVSVGAILKALKIKQGDINEGFGKYLAKHLGIDIDQMAQVDPDAATDALKTLMKKRVSRDVANDLRHFREPFTSPKPVHEILQAFDSATNLFKGSVTSPWPAFHVRNFFSGQFQNYAAGMFSMRSVRDTYAMLKGGAIEGAKEFPLIKQMAASQGLRNLTDEQATNMIGQLVYSQGLSHRFQGEALNVTGAANQFGPSSLKATMEEIPGYGVNHIQPGRVARKATFREPGTTFNPLRQRGVNNNIESAFGLTAAGEEVAGVVESFNRISPFLHQLRKGVDPTAAATKVGAAQVQYQARYYTNAERQLFKRLFPFYSFSSRVMPWTLKQLAEQPSGRLAQSIRVANRLRNPNIMTPDYVAETMSIPVGETPEGGQKYITGMGLMHEDPMSFAGGGVRGALLEAGSRLNPMIKAPLEWMTGQTFFQKGPMGGRSLEDLDPTIGRTISNLTGQRDAVKLPPALEFAVANSPLARVTTTARTATYPVRALTDPTMKGEFLPEVLRTAANLGSGLRITNVSPAAQDALLRERAQRLMKQAGGKTFIKTYIPAEVEAQMTPQELADAQQLEALMNTLTNRSKARAEVWKKAEAARRGQ